MDLYPPSPASPPAALTAPSLRYRARVVLVLVELFVFLLLYVGLVVLLLYGLRELWSVGPGARPNVRAALAFYGGGSVILLGPLAFLLKGLLFREVPPQDGYIEVTREQQPLLFQFIARLAAETRGPMPHKVYVSPDVNAAVFYERSMLSLIWPAPKSLVIGLGLVNYLTLSELKAVLGHELGHFSQRAMGVGTYVYTAQRVVVNLVYSRDAFDDLLDGAKRSDFRIAIFAYVVSGIVWVIRGTLRLAFELVALGHRSLGREMEFGADRVAVLVAGGEEIARGLYKAEVADGCFAFALGRIIHAADRGLVTDDFFHHHERALEDVRADIKDPSWGDADKPLKEGKMLFLDDGSSKPSMWATHPQSSERERAARSHGVVAGHDARSAWLLFHDAKRLRSEATIALYRMRVPHARSLPRPAAELEAVFDEERKEAALMRRAGAMYTGRPLAALDLEKIFRRTPRPRPELEAAHAGLYGRETEDLGKRFERDQSRLATLIRAQRGELRPEALLIDGEPRAIAEVPELIKQTTAALEAIDKSYEKIDRRVAEVHAEIALTLGGEHPARLRTAYEREALYGRWHKRMMSAQSLLQPHLARLSQGNLSEHEGQVLLGTAEDLRAATFAVWKEAEQEPAPPFLALAKGSRLGKFLLAHSPATPLEPPVDDAGEWLRQVLVDGAEVMDKLSRLQQRAVAAILREHEELHLAWTAEADAPPDASATIE